MSRHPLNVALIDQLLFDINNGQLRRSLELGFSEENIRILKQSPKTVNMLLNTPVRWTKTIVDPLVFERLLNREVDIEKEVAIIDEMIRLEASSKMLTDVFKLDQREVAFRRKVLGVEEKRGRWREIDDQQNHQLWREWEAKVKHYHLDTHDLLDMAKVCMVLAREHTIPMAMIWQAQEKWMQDYEPSQS